MTEELKGRTDEGSGGVPSGEQSEPGAEGFERISRLDETLLEVERMKLGQMAELSLPLDKRYCNDFLI
jgi:hypothetical protein